MSAESLLYSCFGCDDDIPRTGAMDQNNIPNTMA
jgi:hypothetical protein